MLVGTVFFFSLPHWYYIQTKGSLSNRIRIMQIQSMQTQNRHGAPNGAASYLLKGLHNHQLRSPCNNSLTWMNKLYFVFLMPYHCNPSPTISCLSQNRSTINLVKARDYQNVPNTSHHFIMFF